LEAGIYIPHLCHHPDLRPVGTCGVCVVDVGGTDEPSISCTSSVVAGMVVKTKTPRVERLRRQAMDVMLANHPPECEKCGQYLNCELQSVKQYLGFADATGLQSSFQPIPFDTRNPLFVHGFVRCVQCGRCVRACDELRGAGVLQFIDDVAEAGVGIRGGKSLVGTGCLSSQSHTNRPG
jgi:formate dehydrogenase beta subunit